MADVVLTTVHSRVEAELLLGLLREYGIDARARFDDLAGMQPSMSLVGVPIVVDEADEEHARNLLASPFDATDTGDA